MIKSASWTGMYGGRPSLAVDLWALTPSWLWSQHYWSEIRRFRLLPWVLVTPEAIQDHG
jgi:hypothetical protein